MLPNSQIPIVLGPTNTIAEVVVPTAIPNVTKIWLPERIPDIHFPDQVNATVDWLTKGSTSWRLRSYPGNIFFYGLDDIDFEVFRWWADIDLEYSGEGATKLEIALTSGGSGAYATVNETMTWTGTTLGYFFSGDCTSTSEATFAKCTGSYGVTGGIYASVHPGGSTVTISPISYVTQFPTAPRVTTAAVTVTNTLGTSPRRNTGALSTTSPSSGRGAPRPTQPVAVVLGAAVVLGGAAAMVV
ncbi:hypothetical protein MGG_08759 [Pyricularia oryzae 70-15]|uniref:Uncharacterized protein n=3 Tax=Pyricularia oryzae TaxID=318829 RepID=G4NFQ0_PYRO7|nr:uncharacterized protein MGG_08759 [Pyricularia oryzae 70-15]EHA46857.1 hypothetical protein MGG_08759 [Pyricularia oryzae 70-15]ELQ32650.1 hypothetical protein OOU_Y34scaffold01075g6 [Pyricularia oryzae Y34]KAI7921653.1 hypothetical protein M0657_005968 [Pyricularia oryzae]